MLRVVLLPVNLRAVFAQIKIWVVLYHFSSPGTLYCNWISPELVMGNSKIEYEDKWVSNAYSLYLLTSKEKIIKKNTLLNYCPKIID